MAYSQEQIEVAFNSILKRIELGESLRSVLRDNEMPSSKTFYEWIDLDATNNKVKQYARACELRAENIFEDMLEIADDGTNDFMTITKGDLEYNVEDKEVTNRSRLRLDARKWMLSKMQPKKYGDKMDLTSGGEKLDQPKKLTITIKKNEDN